MNALIYQFQADHPNVIIEYEMNGSGDGIKNTISGLYEIGHSSRELKTDGSEAGLVATAYAIDGIAIIVNLDNPVASLTQEQVRQIFTGQITNWNELGGSDALISVVSREAGSGTRSAFAEIIGFERSEDETTSLVANATITDTTGGVQTAVAQNPNAIGYLSFSDVDTTRVNTVAYEGVPVSIVSLMDGTYQLKREFYLLTREGGSLSPAAQAFLDFVMSDEGQAIVASQNLLPIG
jgi:phosphate transport system substrate-binding protein